MNSDALRQALTLASAFKEGDRAVGGGADPAVRRDARQALLACTIGDIHGATLVDDGVSEALARARDRSRDAELGGWTVARVRDALLAADAAAWAAAWGPSLGSESIAAVAKVMTRAELSAAARALAGPDRRLGSRIQPNGPGDDEREILF